jgi:lipoprotein-anchoring transpeptidase ErfK/SrfK
MNAIPASRRGLLFILLLLGAGFSAVLCWALFTLVSPVTAASKADQPPATSTAAPFVMAHLPKPTYTPVATFTPSATVPPSPTATSALEITIVEEPALPSRASEDVAPAYAGGKYILVDISDQHMYVYENDALLYSFVASTGINNGTRTGVFHVQSKIPNAYGATWNIWMPNWLGIYWAGGLENGIHSLPILPSGAELWSGYLGHPISYGCVVLSSYDSTLLYNWAEIGVPVEIQW